MATGEEAQVTQAYSLGVAEAYGDAPAP